VTDREKASDEKVARAAFNGSGDGIRGAAAPWTPLTMVV
jgi:hypothetical protein